MDPIKMKKRVTFSNTAICQGISNYTTEESKLCWFTKADLTQFANEAQEEANCFQLKQKGKNNPKSFFNILSHVLKCCANGEVPATSNFQYFLMWHRVCPNLRGIERRCAPLIANFLDEHVEDSTMSVIELQMKLKVENVALAQKCELIQKQYTKKAELSRLFARIQGIADASEAANERKRHTRPTSVDDDKLLSLPFKKRKCGHSSEGICEVYPAQSSQ
mmetsp:Transcript_25786/g.38099  ORF Transcript_25786/g.38099 Transcript_25786/m.38099 type:complete len:220 (+) Transcript_25786:73-732(+)